MKAINRYGHWRGQIRNEDDYNGLKSGELHWKRHIESGMDTIEIPTEIFYRLLELDRSVDSILSNYNDSTGTDMKSLKDLLETLQSEEFILLSRTDKLLTDINDITSIIDVSDTMLKRLLGSVLGEYLHE